MVNSDTRGGVSKFWHFLGPGLGPPTISTYDFSTMLITEFDYSFLNNEITINSLSLKKKQQVTGWFKVGDLNLDMNGIDKCTIKSKYSGKIIEVPSDIVNDLLKVHCIYIMYVMC